MMLAEPMLSESDLQIGKQSLVRVGIGEPQYVLGLIYNSTIEKTVEMIRKFSSQELINHINYIDLLSSLEGVLRKPIHNSEFTTMLNQHLTLANIYVKL
uniref:Uncharacterized protein n=1 Tax=Romanomermis culicivorax TaxID=13658 RepID=A0A915HGN8_ROMCU